MYIYVHFEMLNHFFPVDKCAVCLRVKRDTVFVYTCAAHCVEQLSLFIYLTELPLRFDNHTKP